MIKIMIADDESYEREILNTMVTEAFAAQVQIRMAENGRDAVTVATLWGADIILMDIEMPGINGIDAAKQILAQNPKCKVIFITAYSLFTYAHEAVKLGACDYILKPVNADDVTKAVQLAIHRIEAQHQLESLAASAKTATSEKNEENISVLMCKVKKYLQHNYMMYDISLDSISEVLHINASYFSVQFKQAFGVNFVEYLTDLRITAAKELLQDPLRSTAEIAGMVGYDSANYFTRAFKKKVGMTPTEFRRASSRLQEGIER